MFFFDLWYFVFLAPAIVLTLWAQYRVKTTFAQGMRVDARLSGAAAARYILDRAGCQDVGIEETHGMLSDHYDPAHRVLRLSRDVYHSQSASAVGIAAHEAGHALQHAQNYMLLVVRNAAVPAAKYGPMAFFGLLILGFLMQSMTLIWLGIIAFGGLLFFQVVNLPVEFNASSRAKQILTEYQIVDEQGAAAVSSVLNSAAWTYVAATLETLLIMPYYIFRLTGSSRE